MSHLIYDGKYFNENDAHQGTVIDKTWFKFLICNVSLSQNNTNYLCFQISVWSIYFVCIGKTKNLIQQLMEQKYVHGYVTTVPSIYNDILYHMNCFYMHVVLMVIFIWFIMTNKNVNKEETTLSIKIIDTQ